MRVLAIDPGTTESGWVIWDGHTLLDGGHTENQELLKVALEACQKTMTENVVIEMVASYGMAVGKSTFETCVWIGRFMQELSSKYLFVGKPIHVELMFRKDVKMHLCNSMRAKDTNINQSLRDRFGEKPTKQIANPVYGSVKMNNHTWASFALAVTYFDKNTKS